MKAELYASTGFNAVNVPDSITTLRSLFTPVKTYDNINLNQSIWQPELRVSGLDPKVARTIDYVVIQGDPILEESAYTVDHFSFVAPNICSFSLYIDAYNTMGGLGATSGNLILSGTAKRMHVTVADDNATFFTLPEPFQNADREMLTTSTVFDDIENDPISLISVTSVPPAYVDVIAKTGESTIFNDVKVNLQAPSTIEKAPEVYGQKQDWVEITNKVDDVEVKSYHANLSEVVKVRSAGSDVTATRLTQYMFNKAIMLNPSEVWFRTVTAFDFSNDNISLVNEIVRYGLEGCIVAIWEVPDCFMNIKKENTPGGSGFVPGTYSVNKETKDIGIGEIENKEYNKTVVLPSVTCYNNKVRYGQSRSVTLFSYCSGNAIVKSVYEVTGGTPSSPDSIPVYITADIRPGGAPACMFKMMNNKEKTKPIDAIVGKPWRVPTLAANALHMEYQAKMTLAEQKEAKNKQALVNGINSFVQGILYDNNNNVPTVENSGLPYFDASGLGDPYNDNPITMHQSMANGSIGNLAKFGAKIGKSALSAVANVAASYVNTQIQYQSQMEILNRRAAVAGSNLSIGNSDVLRDATSNNFGVVVSTFTPEDINGFDTFLTRFGYNVGNRRITNTDFSSRPAYNFVQVNEMTIQSVTGNTALVNLAIAQLQIGLRIWHKAPNAADMEASGNR